MKAFLNIRLLEFIVILVIITLPTYSQSNHWNGPLDTISPIYRVGSVGIGLTNNPVEKLEINGRIKLGDSQAIPSSAGLLRWDGKDFQGYNGSSWKSMTSKWNLSGNDIINNNTGNIQLGSTSKLGIGRAPNAKLEIYSVDPGQNWNTGLQLTAHYSAEIPSDPTTYIVQRDNGFYIRSSGGYNFMSDDGNTNYMHISSVGNVGIGTTSPNTKFELNGDVFVNSETASIDLFKMATLSTENLPVIKMGVDNNKRSNFSMGYWTLPSGPEENPIGYVEQVISFTAGSHSYIVGSLSIGKTTIGSGYLFDVNGKIRANEIVVNTTGADFVFENDYKLQSLNEVETFIKENKHLPSIPTAKEVETKGISLGEMQTKLLQKIEELTLYIIQQEKYLNELKEENEQIKKDIYK